MPHKNNSCATNLPPKRGRRVLGNVPVPIFVLILLSANIMAILVTGGYQIRLAGHQLKGYGLHKPLLVLEAAFILSLLWKRNACHRPERFELPVVAQMPLFLVATVLGVAALYSPALGVHFQHHDWDHRHISASINSITDLARLFVTPQGDGFFRPLTFVSLWLDYRMFREHFWAYHLQSVALHVINTLLVAVMAFRLGFEKSVARAAALFFGVAGAGFEAVLWPAARFDLLATAFTMLAVICLALYLKEARPKRKYAVLSVACFILGVLNKESAYCFLAVAPFLICRSGIFSANRKTILSTFVVPLSLAAAALVLVRYLIYVGFGGYILTGGESAHFVLTWRSIYSLARNVPTLPIFAINTSIGDSVAAKLLAGSIAFLLPIVAWHYRGGRVQPIGDLLVLAFLSAIPMLNLIGWISPTLQHGRFLYLPSVWMSLAVVCAVSRCGRRNVLLALLLTLNSGAVVYNVWVYRDMLARTHWISDKVRNDVAGHGASIRAIVVLDFPDAPNGVFFFKSELLAKMKAKMPGVRIALGQNEYELSRDILLYRWNPARRVLDVIPRSGNYEEGRRQQCAGEGQQRQHATGQNRTWCIAECDLALTRGYDNSPKSAIDLVNPSGTAIHSGLPARIKHFTQDQQAAASSANF
jgi:hypothetical protein